MNPPAPPTAAAIRSARDANRAGEHLQALQIVGAALGDAVGADRITLLQQKALALARSAATDQALQTLAQIRAEKDESADTAGLSGRIYKDLAEGCSNKEERAGFYRQSLEAYRAGFERTRSPYCGINAAALAVLTGDLALAGRFAGETLAQPPEDDPYWSLATRAEAALILRHDDEAADLYRQVGGIARERLADLAATRKQCRALSAVLHGRRGQFDACFPRAAVAVFAGHIVDQPGRATPRFPADAEPGVRARIAAWLGEQSIRLSYSSAAAGSDLLFLETAQVAGVETHVVLPFAVERFVETSVLPGGEGWVERFQRVLARAASVTVVNDDVADDVTSAYEFNNRMVAAKAALRASALETDEVALCVWNEQPGDGRGGTADTVEAWAKAKIKAWLIHPTQPARDGVIQSEQSMVRVPFERTRTALPTGSRMAVCTVMHVFFKDYFALHENQHPLFQQVVLGKLAEVVAASSFAPAGRYGLGPDYVFVFDEPKAAGLFAIAVLDALAESLRTAAGLTMAMPRVCLHAGPVRLMVNPVLNQYTHEGTTVTRAGRIVRGIEAGVAYCTEPFAALAALDSVGEFRCGYAGIIEHGDNTRDCLFSLRYRNKTRVNP